MSDYYQTLGVDKNAGADDIKAAYRKLAMKYHPDRNRNDETAEKKFKDVRRAYQVLSDPERRQAYDRFGEAGVNGGGNAAGASGFGFSGNMDDVFSDLFGDIFSGGRRTNRGRDQEVLLTLDFIEAAKGCEKQMRVPQVMQCDTCGGDGAKPGSGLETCEYCGGRGGISGGQGFFSVMQACPQCRGSGRIIRDPCTDCGGQGRVRRTRNLTIKVPSGIDEGMRIRLTGGGEAGPRGGEYGDLYVVVSVKKHPLFRREGRDLLLSVVIPVTTAVLGAEIEVPTLNEKVKLKVPAGTQSGALLRLRGKGVHFEHSGEVGDMICKVKVEVPIKLSREQKELFKQLDRSLNGLNGLDGSDGSDGAQAHQPRRKDWTRKVKDFFSDL